MQKLFDEVGSLDQRCYKDFFLSEDILMEHAAHGMALYIKKHFAQNSTVIVACGSGNNGADGFALARLLYKDFDVKILSIKEPKSAMALLQRKRCETLEIPKITQLQECDVFVDAVVGTGFKGEFNDAFTNTLKQTNNLQAFKIACDVPSGLSKDGVCANETFRADMTLTMGALKRGMFLDAAKEYVGTIEVIDLGVNRVVYETTTNWNLLDLDDLQLPYRIAKDSHKGTFGHLAIARGEKEGASILSAMSALRFGSGLVTLVGFSEKSIPYDIMSSHTLPKNTTALALGMGLGDEFSKSEISKLLNNTLALIADADIFFMDVLSDILRRESVVLTPHPKEFVALLKHTNIADISIKELQEKRFYYVEVFCKKFPNITLLLKGANVIIGKADKFFINPHGSAVLAKGGSGDVLSGLIGALLAQGFSPLDAAMHASLAHSKLALNFKGANFALSPQDLINEIVNL